MQLRSALALPLALFAIHDQPYAAPLHSAVIDRAPSAAIVELFTSEGCSSSRVALRPTAYCGRSI
jgi:hypothetical protein